MNVSECIDVCVLSILGVYICVCGPCIRCEYYVCVYPLVCSVYTYVCWVLSFGSSVVFYIMYLVLCWSSTLLRVYEFV